MSTPAPDSSPSLESASREALLSVIAALRDQVEERTSERDDLRERLAEAERRARDPEDDLLQVVDLERTRLEAVLRNLPVGVWIADRDGRITGKNQEADRIWMGEAPLLEGIPEYSRYTAWFEETGQPLTPQDYPVARALVTERPVDPVELRIRRFDGTEGSVLVSAAPTHDPQGRLTGVVGVNVDITDRRRREAHAAFLARIQGDFARLTSADEIFQSVGASLGDHLKVSSCNFLDVDESREQELTVTYSWRLAAVPSMLGRHRIQDFLTDDFVRACRAGNTFVVRDTQTDPRTDAAAYAGVETGAFVGVPFHRDGEWRFFLSVTDTRPRDWRDDEIALIEELTNRLYPRVERARAEEALRESEEKYRTLFYAMDEGYVSAEILRDEDGRPVDLLYLDANPAASEITGVPQFAGRRLLEIDPGFEPYWLEICARVARTGIGERLERHAAPLQRWYDVRVSRIGGPGSDRVALLFQDITERVVAREELRRANENLVRVCVEADTAREVAERASLAKSQFLAVISHELRTPLTGVIGYTDLLETEVLGPMTPGQQDALARIKGSSWHLVGIIDEILTLSRVEAGKEEVHLAPTDVAEITREVVTMIEPQAQAARLLLCLDGATDPLVTVTDAGKVRQILTNLVGNAIKYTGDGEVAVRIHRSDPAWLEVRVRDTGPGIAAEDQERIFEAFTQLDSSHTRTGSGTGLGLAICRRLARLVGGDIHLDSEPGQGSTFTLRLPRDAPQAG